MTRDVLRLDLGELRWERMPDLTRGGRHDRACCAVRGGVVVLGGWVEGEPTASVEMYLGYDSEAEERKQKVLPPLSCGPIYSSAAVAIDESESELGQVLLIGGWDEDGPSSATSSSLGFGSSWVFRLRAWQTGASFASGSTSVSACKERHNHRCCTARTRLAE
jgi:hypothetical protein